MLCSCLLARFVWMTGLCRPDDVVPLSYLDDIYILVYNPQLLKLQSKEIEPVPKNIIALALCIP